MSNIPAILKTALKKPYMAVFLAIFAVLSMISYQLMANLPGEQNLMCIIGGAINFNNISFVLAVSALSGLIAVGLIEAHRNRGLHSVSIGSASTLGVIMGGLTTFCTLCTIPVITFFGIGVSLSFFTEYNGYFKMLSLLFLGLSVYLINQQLKKQCSLCVS